MSSLENIGFEPDDGDFATMPPVNLKHPRGNPSPRPFKPRRAIGDPVASSNANPRFIQPPPPPNIDLSLNLANLLDVTPYETAGQLVFHCVGDTGGVYGTDVEEANATLMESQWHTAANPASQPAFLYILGDVIYQNGQSSNYQSQFYGPFEFYPPHIVAIPGNHDGDTQVKDGDPPDPEPTLTGFLKNFCSPQATAVTSYRDTMTQPYVYWTLDAPFLTVVGLYSNVDGSLDGRGASAQQNWLTAQLKAAPIDKCLIVAVHHPPYSLDTVHGGSPDIGYAIDTAATASGRTPDAVFSGHIHSYQRFTRTLNGREIPYVVSGAGGYANRLSLLHQLQKDASGKELTAPFTTTDPTVILEAANTTDPGFLRITVTATTLTGEYFAVPFTGTPSETPFDVFTLDWTKHTMADATHDRKPTHGKKKHA